MELELRDVVPGDFPIFVELLSDSPSSRMAAFGSRDRDATALEARWKKSLADGGAWQKAIVRDGAVVGFVATFAQGTETHVTYWIARSCWGHGVATRALKELLSSVTTRPLHASAAKDNAASLRVLEKCGFEHTETKPAFAEARGEPALEAFYVLR